MSIEEREDRHHGMGELSEPLFEERGGFPDTGPGQQYESGQQLPPDIANQHRIAESSQGASLLSPPYKEHVTATHDVRPINARDFVSHQQIRAPIEAEARVEFRISFEVPQGFVAILKSFSWVMSNPNRLDLSVVNPNELQFLRIESAGIVQQNYDDLWPSTLFDWSGDPPAAETTQVPLSGSYETYVLGDEGKLIELVGALPAALVPGTDTTLIDFDLYGTLLLKRGLPLQFEPGSN